MTSLLTMTLVAIPLFSQVAFAVANDISLIQVNLGDSSYDNYDHLTVKFNDVLGDLNKIACTHYEGTTCFDASADLTLGGQFAGDTVREMWKDPLESRLIHIVFTADNTFTDITNISIRFDNGVADTAYTPASTADDWVVITDGVVKTSGTINFDGDADDDGYIEMQILNGGTGLNGTGALPSCPASPVNIADNVAGATCYNTSSITFAQWGHSATVATPDALFYGDVQGSVRLWAVWDDEDPTTGASEGDTWQAINAGFGGIPTSDPDSFDYVFSYTPVAGAVPEMGTWAMILATTVLLGMAYSITSPNKKSRPLAT
jgi:hypothetical protein